MQYIILNSKLERVGALSNDSGNGTPFYNDIITQQIADDDQQLNLQGTADTTSAFDLNGNSKNWGHTLDSIDIPYHCPDTPNIKEGNSLAYQDPNNGRWYIMRLTSVTDVEDMSGNHYKEATGVNLCIWKLGKTIHYAQKLRNVNSTRAFTSLLADTGWYYDRNSDIVGGSTDIDFDGSTSDQAMLQQICQTYGAEVDAYVLFPKAVKMPDGKSYVGDFRVALKEVEVRRHMGQDNGARIVYGRNATNISRTVVDDSLYTRLYVYGPDGATCSCKLTHGQPFVQDDVANDLYNPRLPDFAENYLEGAITSQTMKSPERLAEWGLEQLKIFNHPRANYTVGVTNSLSLGAGQQAAIDASLGDTYRVIDEDMDPVLHTEARVIRKQLSFSNPANNKITLGEYTTVNVVTPKFISDLRQGEYNRVNDILNEIKLNPGALSCTIDMPDGTTWHYNDQQKRFIAHIYVLGEDITPLIQKKGFIWQLRQDGAYVPEFETNHANDGQTLVLNNDIKLSKNMDPTVNHDSGDEYVVANAPVISKDPNDQTFSNNFGLKSDVDAPETVTGEVRLSIDTDYITDQSSVNFNTNPTRLHRVFTVGHWTDSWGDDRVGALQYISWDPNTQSYYASLVYYGRNRPRNGQGKIINRLSHTEIARLDKDGNYKDSMIMLFSHHNSNFGLDYAHTTTNENPYIWTTFNPNNKDKWEIARLQYQPGAIIRATDPSVQIIREYGEDGIFVNYDNSSDMVLVSHDDTSVAPSHPVEFYHANDLLENGNNASPFTSIRLTDYGLVPKNETYSIDNNHGSDNLGIDANTTKNTFQSCSLHYPFFFFDSGDVNMSDERMVWCVDISSGHQVFAKDLDLNQFNLSQPNNVVGNNPGNYVFVEPEGLNWRINDDGSLAFLITFNVGFENNHSSGYKYSNEGIPVPNYTHYELLYNVGMDLNTNNKAGGDNTDSHSDNGHPVG